MTTASLLNKNEQIIVRNWLMISFLKIISMFSLTNDKRQWLPNGDEEQRQSPIRKKKKRKVKSNAVSKCLNVTSIMNKSNDDCMPKIFLFSSLFYRVFFSFFLYSICSSFSLFNELDSLILVSYIFYERIYSFFILFHFIFIYFFSFRYSFWTTISGTHMQKKKIMKKFHSDIPNSQFTFTFLLLFYIFCFICSVFHLFNFFFFFSFFSSPHFVYRFGDVHAVNRVTEAKINVREKIQKWDTQRTNF